MIQLITPEEANTLLVRAWKEVNQYGLRFGQALFSCLPDNLYKHFTDSEHDFYYWEDSTRVLQTFYKHYVRN